MSHAASEASVAPFTVPDASSHMADDKGVSASILCGCFLIPQVIIFFKAVGAAPVMKQKKFKLKSSVSFQSVVDFLRKQVILLFKLLFLFQLRSQPGDSLFLFINRSFQPSPEESVSDLFKAPFSLSDFCLAYLSVFPRFRKAHCKL